MADHPDFKLPWVQAILTDPNITIRKEVGKDFHDGMTSNSMFNKTLYTTDAVKAHLAFGRPCKEPDAVRNREDCFLMSVGNGVDGKTGRAHGGFNSLILDQMCGFSAHWVHEHPNPPATATLTVDYKAPVDTPGVILARSWIIELSGRKIWVKAVIQDGDGKVLASGKALFITPRQTHL